MFKKIWDRTTDMVAEGIVRTEEAAKDAVAVALDTYEDVVDAGADLRDKVVEKVKNKKK